MMTHRKICIACCILLVTINNDFITSILNKNPTFFTSVIMEMNIKKVDPNNFLHQCLFYNASTYSDFCLHRYVFLFLSLQICNIIMWIADELVLECKRLSCISKIKSKFNSFFLLGYLSTSTNTTCGPSIYISN